MTAAPAPTARTVAVVGAGPKAAALAAKAHVLNELGVARLDVRILERNEIAAHWTGRHGWTSGTERLGTRVEKDVGFPYRSTSRFGPLGKEIDARMQAFSWQSHLIDTGGYQHWIDAGLPQPTHRQFTDYLRWVLARAVTGVSVQQAEVVGLRYRADGWALVCSDGDGISSTGDTPADGLVLTGHGVPNTLPHDPRVAARLLTPAVRRERIHRLGLGPGSRVCLVGSGESAASFALYLWDQFGESVAVSVVAPALPHSRAESLVEDRVYSDPQTAAWPQLPEALRRDFINRTDRGVISPAALRELARNPNVGYLLGRVRRVDLGPTGRAEVVVDQPDEVLRAEYDLVVNCTGSSPLAQLRELLDPRSTAEVQRRLGLDLTDGRSLAREFGADLALRGLRPRLHLPALAGLAQGPGFANLSSLGLLSDRILGAYCGTDPGDHPDHPDHPARLSSVTTGLTEDRS